MEMEVEVKEDGGLGFPHWVACLRKIGPHDPFFTSGNAERELLAKQVIALSLSPLPRNDFGYVLPLSRSWWPEECLLRRSRISSLGWLLREARWCLWCLVAS